MNVIIRRLNRGLGDTIGSLFFLYLHPSTTHVALSTVAIGDKISAMARQTTLNVSLTPTLGKYVRSKVKSGHYESASEVIRDSLRALQQREHLAEVFWADLREKVAVARQDVAEGRTEDGETAMDEILSGLKGNRGRASRKRAG